MTTATQNIGTQKGSIQVKMNEYYTATVRNLSDLERMLADENESKSELEILSSYNVSKEFEAAVKAMVSEYKGEPTEKLVRVDLEEFRRDGTVYATFPNCLVSVRKDGKVKFEGDDFGGAYRFRFQKVKETSFGEYINVYGKRAYISGGAPLFNN